MNILNAKYITQKIDWSSITFPLLPGTPISAAGQVSNDSDAIGIVTEKYAAEPYLPCINILVAGDVDASEILYELSDAAKEVLVGIRIFSTDGSFGGFVPKLYSHCIEIDETIDDGDEEDPETLQEVHVKATLISTNPAELTLATLKTKLPAYGILPATGSWQDFDSDNYDIFVSGILLDSTTLKCGGIDISDTPTFRTASLELDDTSSTVKNTFADTVSEV